MVKTSVIKWKSLKTVPPVFDFDSVSVFTCLFSASFTAWFTWLRMFLQHSPAFFTFSLSSPSSVDKGTHRIKKSNDFSFFFSFVNDSIQCFRSKLYLCIWRCSPAAAGTLSVAAFPQEWGLWAAAVDTDGYSRLPEETMVVYSNSQLSVYVKNEGPSTSAVIFSPAALTCMNKWNLWSFFFLVLMSSRADGWLLQKVPTACLIFSSSSPLNWNQHKDMWCLHFY